MNLARFFHPCLVLALLFFGNVSGAKAAGEAKFVVEFFQKSQNSPQQTIEIKESEKEKTFLRHPDQAQCSLRIGEVAPLVASYRKVELEMQCQEAYTKSTTSVVCLYSSPDALPAEIVEKKSKLKEMQVDLGPLPQGVEVKEMPHRRKKKRAVTRLSPAWDSTGCQKLGEGVDSLGGDKPQSRIKCCCSP